MSGDRAPVTVAKSSRSGHVGLTLSLRCGGWSSDSARIDASTKLTLEQARTLARELLAQADREDAKAAAKAASEERRRRWREREIAAGRMIVLGHL